MTDSGFIQLPRRRGVPPVIKFIMQDDPNNFMTWTKCFAVPGRDSLIDLVHPVTGRTQINAETLDEVRLRYPDAVLMTWSAFVADKAARQDNEPRQWNPVTEDRYHDMMNVLPPAAMVNGAFLVGEASDHHAGTGRPRFAAFKQEAGNYFELSTPITLAEFRTTFGDCKNLYVE